jgi:hypothetical protein
MKNLIIVIIKPLQTNLTIIGGLRDPMDKKSLHLNIIVLCITAYSINDQINEEFDYFHNQTLTD